MCQYESCFPVIFCTCVFARKCLNQCYSDRCFLHDMCISSRNWYKKNTLLKKFIGKHLEVNFARIVALCLE